MGMKKMFMSVSALFLFVLSSLFTDVGATAKEFKTEGQKKIPTVTIAPFKVGNSSVNINMEPYGYVYTRIESTNENKLKEPEDKTVTIPCSALEKSEHTRLGMTGTCQGRSYTVSGYRADGGGNYTVKFEKPLAEGDRVFFSFADDGNGYFGSLIYKVPQPEAPKVDESPKPEAPAAPPEPTKPEADKEQPKSEEDQKEKPDTTVSGDTMSDADMEAAFKLFKQSIEDENNKTWQSRLKETFEDSWANFKGWFYSR